MVGLCEQCSKKTILGVQVQVELFSSHRGNSRVEHNTMQSHRVWEELRNPYHYQVQQQHQPEANSSWIFSVKVRNRMKVSVSPKIWGNLTVNNANTLGVMVSSLGQFPYTEASLPYFIKPKSNA